MLKTIVAALLLTLAPTAHAFDEWTKTDVVLEVAAELLIVIDWTETASLAEHGWRAPGGGRYANSAQSPNARYTAKENNPLLGKHPSLDRLNAFCISTLVLHPVIAHVLPRRYRTVWQGVTIAIELPIVASNAQVRGVHLTVPF